MPAKITGYTVINILKIEHSVTGTCTYNNGIHVHVHVRVTIFSTGGKFQPVSNFRDVHAFTQTSVLMHSYYMHI